MTDGRWRKYKETEEDRVRARQSIAFFEKKRTKTQEYLKKNRARTVARLQEDGWTPQQIALRMMDL